MYGNALPGGGEEKIGGAMDLPNLALMAKYLYRRLFTGRRGGGTLVGTPTPNPTTGPKLLDMTFSGY